MPANVVGLWAVSESQSSARPQLVQERVQVVDPIKPFVQDHRPQESEVTSDSGDQLASTQMKLFVWRLALTQISCAVTKNRKLARATST